MQPTITRYLKSERADRHGLQKIHMRVCWSGMKVRFSTGESVNPDHWYQGTDADDDEIRGRVTKLGGVTGKNINRRLSIYTSELEKFFDNRLLVPKPAEVQDEIERIRTQCLGQEAKVITQPEPTVPLYPSLTDFVQQFLSENKTGKSVSWYRSNRVLTNHLLAFRDSLDWQNMTLATLNQFRLYLQDELELSDPTMETYVGFLRGFCKYAARTGMPIPGDYVFLEVNRAGDAILPELTHQEVARIAEADLSGTGSLSISSQGVADTRWYFSVACGTGLRHSDLWQMQAPRILNIDGVPCVEVRQQKTKRNVPVPLNEETYELLKHPPKNSPYTLVQYNKAIKFIAERAELNRIAMVGSYYKGNLVAENLPIREIINSHMARRTYATLMTAGGMPTRTLQIIMGHATISSTEKYAKVPDHTIVQHAMDSWKKSKLMASLTPLP